MSADFVRNEYLFYNLKLRNKKNTNTKKKAFCLYLFFKRFFDIILAFSGIIILFPIWIIISILIKIDSKGHVFYKQTRVGKNFNIFKIIKFRTMIDNADKNGEFITSLDDNRITKLGHFLRKYKIDELPQLFNVLTGNMSLVGPRPEVPLYINNTMHKEVLSVKPGITDFASIKYRNENEMLHDLKIKGINIVNYYNNIILKDKINLNLKYIEEKSLLLDILIIIKTIFYIKKDHLKIKNEQ